MMQGTAGQLLQVRNPLLAIFFFFSNYPNYCDNEIRNYS